MAWRALFSGWLDWSLSSKLERGSVDAGALVCAIMHSRAKPTRDRLSHPGCPPCTSRSLCFFMKREIRGGAENLSPARRQVPL